MQNENTKFVLRNVLQALIWLGLIVVLIIFAERFLPDEVKNILDPLQDKPALVFAIFFSSEFLFGLVPIEFYVRWFLQQDTANLWETFIILGFLTYMAGFLAFLIGKSIRNTKTFKKLRRNETFLKYAKLYRRFGGAIIILASLTPLPFSTICFVSGSFDFSTTMYLIYSAARFIRVAVLVGLMQGF